MKKQKNALCIRKFLNKKGYGSNAAISATIPVGFKEICQKSENGRGKHVLTISDCQKSIFMNMDIQNKKELSNTLYKIDVLVSVLLDMKKCLEKEFKK